MNTFSLVTFAALIGSGFCEPTYVTVRLYPVDLSGRLLGCDLLKSFAPKPWNERRFSDCLHLSSYFRFTGKGEMFFYVTMDIDPKSSREKSFWDANRLLNTAGCSTILGDGQPADTQNSLIIPWTLVQSNL